MRNKLILLLIIFGTSIASAQPNLKNHQKLAYIISADGIRTDVAIEVNDADQPWTFQSGIKYYDRALLTGTRIKRELKKDLIPGEIAEYGFENRRFVYVSYYAKSKGEDILKATVDKFKGDKNTDYFAEIIHDGKMKLLRFYIPPVISDDDYDDNSIMQKYIQDAKDGYDILISREGLGTKAIQEINIKSFFEDCPFVLNKFERELYKIKPVSGLKKLLTKDRLSGINLENAAMKVVGDYDEKCGK